MGWEIHDLDNKQHPGDTFRGNFIEVVMLPVLRAQLKIINDWLDDDQVEEVVKPFTACFPETGFIENNRHVLNLLLENTSISENRELITSLLAETPVAETIGDVRRVFYMEKRGGGGKVNEVYAL